MYIVLFVTVVMMGLKLKSINTTNVGMSLSESHTRAQNYQTVFTVRCGILGEETNLHNNNLCIHYYILHKFEQNIKYQMHKQKTKLSEI